MWFENWCFGTAEGPVNSGGHCLKHMSTMEVTAEKTQPWPWPLPAHQLYKHARYINGSVMWPWTTFQYKDSIFKYRIPIIEIIQSWDCLIFIMGIPLLVRKPFNTEVAIWCPLQGLLYRHHIILFKSMNLTQDWMLQGELFQASGHLVSTYGLLKLFYNHLTFIMWILMLVRQQAHWDGPLTIKLSKWFNEMIEYQYDSVHQDHQKFSFFIKNDSSYELLLLLACIFNDLAQDCSNSSALAVFH